MTGSSGTESRDQRHADARPRAPRRAPSTDAAAATRPARYAPGAIRRASIATAAALDAGVRGTAPWRPSWRRRPPPRPSIAGRCAVDHRHGHRGRAERAGLVQRDAAADDRDGRRGNGDQSARAGRESSGTRAADRADDRPQRSPAARSTRTPGARRDDRAARSRAEPPDVGAAAKRDEHAVAVAHAAAAGVAAGNRWRQHGPRRSGACGDGPVGRPRGDAAVDDQVGVDVAQTRRRRWPRPESLPGAPGESSDSRCAARRLVHDDQIGLRARSSVGP